MPDDILDMIGTAAALEQLGEESAELAQAALKMARKLRGCGVVHQHFARRPVRPRRGR